VLNLLGLEHTVSIGISRGRAEVEQRQARLIDVADQLRHTGGEISLYAHECEFVTAQFWDGVNFSGGRDTPRDEWQPAPLVSAAESESRYAAMGGLLAAFQSLPDVEIVVASQLPALYADGATVRSFTPDEIVGLCAPMADAITHRRLDGACLSPAEVFSLAVRLLAERARSGQWPDQVPYSYVDGPARLPRAEKTAGPITLDGVLGTCLYETAHMRTELRIPAEVRVGRSNLSPSDFLATVAAALPRWVAGDTTDAEIVPGNFVQSEYIPDHVSWGWTIFPAGFRADALLELGKLQAWTLKPALLSG
jgi:hypothetical protein